MFGEFGINAGYVEELHARWRQSPQAVDADWRAFFDAYENGRAPAALPLSTPPPAPPRETNGSAAKTNGGAAITEAALARASLRPQGAALKDEILAAAGLQ